jgi:hypothetical protein
MKRIKITETQIVQLLKQHEQGVKVADICREFALGGYPHLLCDNGPECISNQLQQWCHKHNIEIVYSHLKPTKTPT